MNDSRKIAIVGSGISGISAALMLDDNYNVTLYEKNNYLGGHSRTVNITVNQQIIPVDTGFIVFNHKTYPLLTKLFQHLSVPTCKSNMSFGVSINNGHLEYGSQNFNTLFSQRKNLVNRKFWRLLRDIFVFNKRAIHDLERNALSDDVSLQQYLSQLDVSPWFIDYYIFAMGAAIWSTPIADMHHFPAKTFLHFFNNHGLLQTNRHPQWYTVDGGSQVYIDKIQQRLHTEIKLGCGVASIIRENNQISIIDNQGNTSIFDDVIIACHSDQALSMLAEPTPDEVDILSNIHYQKNTMILHSDTNFMPTSKRAWSSWVYLANDAKHNESLSLSYWMNNLQPFGTNQPILVTLNPTHKPALSLTHDEYIFEHPVFTKDALIAQRALPTIQGKHNTWFAGAYWQYGFHEDGIKSALDVVTALGETPAWL